MSKALSLPPLIQRYILEKWLGIKSKEKTDNEDRIPPTPDLLQTSPQFFAYFSGSSISDHFYYVPASSSVYLPSDSLIFVTEWNLSFDQGLHLNILQAELFEESKVNKVYLVSIEKNPCIAGVLRRFKYEKMRKCVVDEEGSGKGEVEGWLSKGVAGSKGEELAGVKSEDDGCDMIDDYTDPGVSCNKQTSYRVEDVGIDVFPSYALEYLKHKYNII